MTARNAHAGRMVCRVVVIASASSSAAWPRACGAGSRTCCDRADVESAGGGKRTRSRRTPRRADTRAGSRTATTTSCETVSRGSIPLAQQQSVRLGEGREQQVERGERHEQRSPRCRQPPRVDPHRALRLVVPRGLQQADQLRDQGVRPGRSVLPNTPARNAGTTIGGRYSGRTGCSTLRQPPATPRPPAARRATRR